MTEPGEVTPTLLLGLTGPPGAGKSAFARHLSSLEPYNLDPDFEGYYKDIVRMPMRQLLTYHASANGIATPRTYEELRSYHEAIRASDGLEELYRPAVELGEMASRIIIIDALRDEQDMEYFRNKLGGFIMAMLAKDKVCEQRFVFDNNDSKHMETAPDSNERRKAYQVARQEVEGDGDRPGSTHIRSCIIHSNVIFYTDEPKDVAFPEGVKLTRRLVMNRLNGLDTASQPTIGEIVELGNLDPTRIGGEYTTATA